MDGLKARRDKHNLGFAAYSVHRKIKIDPGVIKADCGDNGIFYCCSKIFFRVKGICRLRNETGVFKSWVISPVLTS